MFEEVVVARCLLQRHFSFLFLLRCTNLITGEMGFLNSSKALDRHPIYLHLKEKKWDGFCTFVDAAKLGLGESMDFVGWLVKHAKHTMRS